MKIIVAALNNKRACLLSHLLKLGQLLRKVIIIVGLSVQKVTEILGRSPVKMVYGGEAY